MRVSRWPLTAWSSAAASRSRDTASSPIVSERSGLMVRKTGLSGRGCCGALEDGRSTAMSTVASGAATMKMMSRTSMTSMNGVTLISWTSSSSSLPWSRRTLIGVASCLLRSRPHPMMLDAAVEIAADEAQHLGRGVAELRAIARDRAGEHIVDHDGRNRGCEPEGRRQQRLGDARRHHGEVRRMRLRDADEAVHDAPHRAGEADERRGRPDGGEHAGGAADPAAERRLDALEARSDALLDAVLIDRVRGEPQLRARG